MSESKPDDHRDVPTEKLRAQYKRLVITSFDLEEAREFASEAIKHLGGEQASPERITVGKALMTALVVAYSRPFSGNESLPGVTGKPSDSVLREYSAAERALHDRLLALRHTEFAHADGEAAQVKVHVTFWRHVKFTIPVSRSMRLPFGASELAAIEGMLSKLRATVFDQMRSLEKRWILPQSF